ncbi:MAG: 5'/3'-nucleotidase SurE [Deltaproteobacteria bacterium]|nr:5'/3'-nucleotidase SurE [Deltaproteobacteria bacterium]MCZ6549220.1 5'/3'-nucleotidase SurE [Deltaproteobacteria bacterium]MCZ6563263.1 5'/3'-nucleotidase SurE [Deltaproteobacteria bacterium]
MMILVSNDDGIQSEGILALEEKLQRLGEVYTVAPDRVQSSMSHAITLHRPLRAKEIGPRRFAVDGTPTDCVKLALTGLLPSKPALVVSGINIGPNLGDDIIYSGTVSAAVEGTLLEVPSIAVSLVTLRNSPFEVAAEFAGTLAARVLEKGLPSGTLLNVNVPPLPAQEVKGWRLTRQGKRRYIEQVVERIDPRGRKYYWIGGDDLGFDKEDGTDCMAIHEGYISVTPLQVDMTNYRVFQEIKALMFPWP